MSLQKPSLPTLPDELIQQVLCHVPPVSIPALQQASRQFNDLTKEPLLWRYYCVKDFRHWSEEHKIQQKLKGYVADVNWKQLYEHRFIIDRKTRHILDSILASQIGRIEKYDRIVDLGYDAKDTLMQQYGVANDAEDVLARRYYSNSVRGYLHRTFALKEWSKFRDGEPVTLERALAAYDMFILHDREGDFEFVSKLLDGIANKICCQYTEFQGSSPRAKALAIARFLIAQNLTGVKSENTYHDLQNNFVALALRDEDHPAMPLISVAIFCSVAQRLGLDARPCAIPFHVYAIVFPPKGSTLDDKIFHASDGEKPMYLDPFQSAEEVPIDRIQTQLSAFGVVPANFPTFLQSTTTIEMVLRSANNIMASVQRAHQDPITAHNDHDPHHQTTISSFPDMESAFFGALWALVLVCTPSEGDGSATATFRQRQVVPFVVEHLQTYFPTDVSTIEHYILPLFQNLPEFEQLRETVRVIRVGDMMPKQVKLRTEEVARHVRHKVGQVFRHRRYAYLATITGWDVECSAGEHWMERMHVDQLSQGRQQSFYHVLVEDGSVRYVAEENIQIVRPETPHRLIALAGSHFKRWDKRSRTFISNIRDEYPDD